MNKNKATKQKGTGSAKLPKGTVSNVKSGGGKMAQPKKKKY